MEPSQHLPGVVCLIAAAYVARQESASPEISRSQRLCRKTHHQTRWCNIKVFKDDAPPRPPRSQAGENYKAKSQGVRLASAGSAPYIRLLLALQRQGIGNGKGKSCRRAVQAGGCEGNTVSCLSKL